MEEVIKEKNSNLAFWQTATATAIELARQKALNQIRPVARKAVTDKDLKTANEAYLEILKINASDTEATAYFQNNGGLDAVKKKLTKSTAIEQSSKATSSMQMLQYEYQDGGTYKKQPDGTWVRLDSAGETIYTLKEIDRNNYSVTLRQKSRHHQTHPIVARSRPVGLADRMEKGIEKEAGFGLLVEMMPMGSRTTGGQSRDDRLARDPSSS